MLTYLCFQLTFTVEAGRRCDSGPGTFIFETQQAEKIFSMIQSTIKRKRTSTLPLVSQIQECEKINVTLRAYSPLPKIPDMAAQGDLSECASAHPVPITLMPLPSIPTHSSPYGSPHSDPSDVVYANPVECIQSAPQRSTAVYEDPACILPLKPPASREAPSPNSSAPHPCFILDHPDSAYSEVYDKISPVQKQQAILSKEKTKRSGDEPIYTVPMHPMEVESHKNQPKSDPFAHLYAQVCKTAASSKPSTLSTSPLCPASSVTVPGRTAAAKDTDQSLLHSLSSMKT